MLDKLTAWETKTRDTILGRFFHWLLPEWVEPNHITLFKVLLLGFAISGSVLGLSLKGQLILLASAGFLDAVDGPIARVRNRETRFGATLDRTTDYILGIWLGKLALSKKLLSISLITWLLVPQLFIWAAQIAFKVKGQPDETTVLDRAQFFLIVVAFILLLAGVATTSVLLNGVGTGLLCLEVLVAWLIAVRKLARLLSDHPSKWYHRM